ncbi:MAG: hypothetical protein QOG13_2263 [Sphingomonadales bacterium]|nr:hypothetical protein [Sphingomonadales bacterium]
MIRWPFRILVALLLAYAAGYGAFALTLPGPAGDEPTDAIVVLTGGTGRLDRGFALIGRGLARRMLISGVARTVRPQELAAAYHVRPRLFECCITLGREAFDTRSNADEVARWLEREPVRSIRLVTNDLHMRRARYELEKRIGAEVTIVSDAVPTEADARQIFVEYNKFLLGWAADRIGI